MTTGAGRKPVVLEINERYGTVVGLEIQPDFFNAIAIDLHGKVTREWSGSLEMIGTRLAAPFQEIMEPICGWIEGVHSTLLGVGVGVPGIVDQTNGVILQSNPLNITEPLHLVREVQDAIIAPVIIENDANSCCWGELAYRKTSRHSSFLFVLGEFRTGETESSAYWGIAIGLGIVLNGSVYHGPLYSAGEFQSILWRPGNEGQLSISNEEARRIKEDGAVMTGALRELCSHIAFLVNTLNLTSVVFGGEITEYKETLVPILDAEIQRNWSYPNKVEYSVEFSGFDKIAVAYGAAGMVLESIFTIPELFSRSGSIGRRRVSVIGS